MAQRRIQIDDLTPDKAGELTADDVNKITGGSLHFNKIAPTYATTSDGKQFFIADSFSFGVEREMKEGG